jgi:hypothetical protein
MLCFMACNFFCLVQDLYICLCETSHVYGQIVFFVLESDKNNLACCCLCEKSHVGVCSVCCLHAVGVWSN